MTAERIAQGDVLTVRTSSGWPERLIDVGTALRGRPSLGNHVVVCSHQDSNGTWWGVEGRPGGVGWADLRRYNNAWTVTNTGQPKTDTQRAAVAAECVKMLGTPYDWTGIAADAAEILGLRHLWANSWHGQGAPGHVVCSSLAAYVYSAVGLIGPHGGLRTVTPGDWTQFCLDRAWEK